MPKVSARLENGVIEAYSQFKLVFPEGNIAASGCNQPSPKCKSTSKFSQKCQTEPKICQERACTVRSEDFRGRSDKKNAKCGTDDDFAGKF